jgi:hypothetical protein
MKFGTLKGCVFGSREDQQTCTSLVTWIRKIWVKQANNNGAAPPLALHEVLEKEYNYYDSGPGPEAGEP